jgi:hypothetical protein
MLTISKLKQWSINYYIDTAQAAEHAARDLARAGGEPDEYWWTGTAWYSRPFASRYSKLDNRPTAISNRPDFGAPGQVLLDRPTATVSA